MNNKYKKRSSITFTTRKKQAHNDPVEILHTRQPTWLESAQWKRTSADEKWVSWHTWALLPG